MSVPEGPTAAEQALRAELVRVRAAVRDAVKRLPADKAAPILDALKPVDAIGDDR